MPTAPSSPSQGDRDGIVAGTHSETNNTILIDRFNTTRNGPHSLSIGDYGVGKTYDTKLEISRLVDASPDIEIVIFDKDGEYEDVGALDIANTLRPENATHNPFHFQPSDSLQATFEDTINNAVDYLLTAIQISDTKIKPDTRSLLYEIVKSTCYDRGIYPSPETDHHRSPSIDEILETAHTLADTSTTGQLTDSLASLESIFNQQPKVPVSSESTSFFANHRISHISLQYLQANQALTTMGYLNELYQYSLTTNHPLLIVIDDLPELLQSVPGQYLKRLLIAGKQTDTAFHFILPSLVPIFTPLTPHIVRSHFSFSRVYSVSLTPSMRQLGAPDSLVNSLQTSPRQQGHSESLFCLYATDEVNHIPVQTAVNASDTDRLFR